MAVPAQADARVSGGVLRPEHAAFSCRPAATPARCTFNCTQPHKTSCPSLPHTHTIHIPSCLLTHELTPWFSPV